MPPMTFIPLDNIRVDRTVSAVKEIAGARLTIDTIDYDPSVKRGMEYACGSSVICDSFDIANHMVYDKRIQVKAVTLEGHVIHKSGLMTGGRLPESKGHRRTFREQDVQNIEQTLQTYRDRMLNLPRTHKLEERVQELEFRRQDLEQSLRINTMEVQSFEKNFDSKQKTSAAAIKELNAWKSKYSQCSSALEKTRQAAAEFEKQIADAEDKVFAGFCQTHGFENIRAYEAQQGSLEQEAAEKRSHFKVHKSKLESTLQWKTLQRDDTVKRFEEAQRRLRQLKDDVRTYQANKDEIEAALEQDLEQLDVLRNSLDELKLEHTKKAEKVADAKAEVQRRSKEIESRQKEVSVLQTEIQKSSASRLGLLRRCKLEQIHIPLLQGTLDSLPSEDQLLGQDADPDAMDVDGDEEITEAAMDHFGLELDFQDLDDELKDVSVPPTPELGPPPNLHLA